MRISDIDPVPRDHRVERLIERLPSSARSAAHWLRQPSARRVRIPAGVLLCLGGLFGMLPVLGFWMLPAGLLLLAEDVPMLTRATSRMLDRLEQWRPQWFAPASSATMASTFSRDEIGLGALPRARRARGDDGGMGRSE
jgi:hypothetical protein